jgi:hypothetical protein
VKGKRNKAAFRQISERNKNLTERIDAGVTKNLRNAQGGAAPLPIYRFDGVAAAISSVWEGRRLRKGERGILIREAFYRNSSAYPYYSPERVAFKIKALTKKKINENSPSP